MKKLALLFLLLICTAAYADENSFESIPIVKKRHEALKRMQQDVIEGKFPVYISVDCKDNAVKNKLKSLMTSALRKKDNVKIVSSRDNAWFWIYVLAIKETAKNVAVSAVFGQDDKAFTFRDNDDFSDVFSFGPQDILNAGGFLIYSWTYDELGELVSRVADEFDVHVLEPARQICEPHIAKLKKK